MSETTPPDSTLPFERFESGVRPQHVFVVQPLRRHYWLHLLLFLATVFTTLVVGSRLQYNFDHNLPAFQSDEDFMPLNWALEHPEQLARGIPFSLTLLGILLAHEMGHFVLAARNHVYATLPYFLPAPTLIGTLGAFIRIRSPIRSRAALFDIGIAGPITGFVVAIPLLLVSLVLSKPGSEAHPSAITLGYPPIFDLAFKLLHATRLVNVDSLRRLSLHPAAFGVWVGMFATALNLLPGGQLDGGHIVYALSPRLHKPISLLTVALLIPLIWYGWVGWFLWAAVVLLTGIHHPPVSPEPRLAPKRRLLAVFALLMFLLTFVGLPFGGATLPEVRQQIRAAHGSH